MSHFGEFVTIPEADHALLVEQREGAQRLLGSALFNLSKGKIGAADILMRKAYNTLAGQEWDGADDHDPSYACACIGPQPGQTKCPCALAGGW